MMMQTACLTAALQLPIFRINDSSAAAHFKIKPYICAQSKPTAQISRSQPLIPSPPAPVLPRVAPESLQYPAGFLGTGNTSAEEGGGMSDAMWHVTGILTSKVYDVAIESPLEFAPKLSNKLGANVWLKREDLQPRVYEPAVLRFWRHAR